MKTSIFVGIAIAGIVGVSVAAQAQTGPVAQSCGADIAKMCANKPHDGSTRICLENNYGKLSAACKKALDTTGGGRGKQLGRGQGKS